jgi:hypothetical protein
MARSVSRLIFFLFHQRLKMAESEEEVLEEPWVPSNEDISNALSGLAKTEDGASVVYTKLALPGKQVFDVRVHHTDSSYSVIPYSAWYSAPSHVLKRSVVRNRERERERESEREREREREGERGRERERERERGTERERERETEKTMFITGALGRS